MSSVVSRPLVGLSLVVMLAVAHALAHAVIRPLYQVSDEVVYLSSVQQAAFERAPQLGRCIAPPEGLVPVIATNTKLGFRTTTSAELLALCAGSTSPLVLLRAVQALSAGIVAGCAWALGWLLSANAAVALLAGLLVAAHPVAATHAGAVTPDAWANAFSALAFLAGTRLLTRHFSWWDVPVLLSCTLAAYAWKDTAGFLLSLPLVVAATRVARWDLSPRDRVAIVLLGSFAIAFSVAGFMWFETPYLRMAALSGPERQLEETARIAVWDLSSQVNGFVASSLTALGNFGSSTLTLPDAASKVGLLLALLALFGLMRRIGARPSTPHAAVLGTWGVTAVLCLAQPSVRLALLGTQDIHQGRWLLPLLAPAATLMAIGLIRLGRQGLVLWSVGALFVAWSGLVETIRYFWEVLPSQPALTSLYIRGTGGRVVDDALLLSAVEHTARTLPAWVPGASLLLFAVLSAASLWSAANTRWPDTRLS